LLGVNKDPTHLRAAAMVGDDLGGRRIIDREVDSSRVSEEGDRALARLDVIQCKKRRSRHADEDQWLDK
jgi:hypothetical protein